MQSLKEVLPGTLSKGIESLVGVQEKRHQENRRLTDLSAYAQVLAQNLCELDLKDEKLVRYALDRIVLNASMDDMSLIWTITGISTNSVSFQVIPAANNNEMMGMNVHGSAQLDENQ